MAAIHSNKIQNAALFADMTAQHSFTNMLVDTADMTIEKKDGNDPRSQSGKGAPIVRVTDLMKQKGDEVELDVFHILNKMPTMGDKKLAGRGETLTSSTMSLKINQTRHMVDPGGRMAKQRTKHDLLAISRNELTGKSGYFGRLCGETSLYHLAGARGTRTGTNLIIPEDTHPEFNDFLVNPIKAPTFDRHFYGGDATSLDTLDSADVFTLTDVERIRYEIDNQKSMIMQPIKYADDMMADESPLYVMLVPPLMFNNLKASTSGKDWQQMSADARVRMQSLSKNPIFAGDGYFWEGIYIKKMSGNWVEFAAGTDVKVCTDSDDATETTVTAAVNTERALILGSSALGWGLGNSGSGGSDKGHVGTTIEEVDHGNGYEVSARKMDGKAKIRFEDKTGRVNDQGVMVYDAAVA